MNLGFIRMIGPVRELPADEQHATWRVTVKVTVMVPSVAGFNFKNTLNSFSLYDQLRQANTPQSSFSFFLFPCDLNASLLFHFEADRDLKWWRLFPCLIKRQEMRNFFLKMQVLVILSRLIARNCAIYSGKASWSWSELQCGPSPLSDWLPPVACRIKSAAERRGGR